MNIVVVFIICYTVYIIYCEYEETARKRMASKIEAMRLVIIQCGIEKGVDPKLMNQLITDAWSDLENDDA